MGYMEKYIPWIIGGVVALILLWVIATYNKLVKLRNRVKDQDSQIDILLKKRYDLIPNIVENVKGYAAHEKETLTAVVEARNSAIANGSKADDNQIKSAIERLLALGESYPELKADAGFESLRVNLKDVEDKITFARQCYNDTVLIYENKIETFPSVIIAKMFGFKKVGFLSVDEKEKENVSVRF